MRTVRCKVKVYILLEHARHDRESAYVNDAKVHGVYTTRSGADKAKVRLRAARPCGYLSVLAKGLQGAELVGKSKLNDKVLLVLNKVA